MTTLLLLSLLTGADAQWDTGDFFFFYHGCWHTAEVDKLQCSRTSFQKWLTARPVPTVAVLLTLFPMSFLPEPGKATAFPPGTLPAPQAISNYYCIIKKD